MNPIFIRNVILAISLLSSTVCWGLDSDNNQLLHITSSQATLDFNAGTMTYQGNVAASQGTRKLDGDKLILSKAQGGGVQNVTAYGNPAKSQYQPDPQDQIAHGQAQIISYIFPLHELRFQDNAYLEQNNNIFKGPLITYNSQTKTVQSPTNNLEPTTITLPPYNQEKLPHD
jgi:lipopolysaccharide export system protein LptA